MAKLAKFRLGLPMVASLPLLLFLALAGHATSEGSPAAAHATDDPADNASSSGTAVDTTPHTSSASAPRNITNSGPVWRVSGKCKIDPLDHECVKSPRFPRRSRLGSRCTLRLLEERYLGPGEHTYSNGLGEAVYFMTFVHENGTVYHGRTVDEDLFQSALKDFTIHWHLTRLGFGTKGWRVCARRSEQEAHRGVDLASLEHPRSWFDSDIWAFLVPLLSAGLLAGICMVYLFFASMFVGIAIQFKNRFGKRSSGTMQRQLSFAKFARSGSQNSEAGLAANREVRPAASASASSSSAAAVDASSAPSSSTSEV